MFVPISLIYSFGFTFIFKHKNQKNATLPVLYNFSFLMHLGARWAYYFEILREYLTGGKICRMVSFQISYIAKITFSWLLDLRGPKRKV